MASVPLPPSSPPSGLLPVVQVRGLRKTYGDFVAVDDLDLEIAAGEIFALLGPNGAGKTTTVEILEGYRARDAGDVLVLGTDPATAGIDWRARVGIVLQSTGAFDQLTVAEVVHHFAGYYPTPNDPDTVITDVGLADKRDTRTTNLSGGQRRRLDVALAIIGRPELVFLDEPTTGFDPEARRQFWRLIQDLRGLGTTIVLTTHYLEEAEALADRVGVIVGGRLVEVGAPDTIGGRAEAGARVSYRNGSELEVVLTDEPTAMVATLIERFDGEIPELTVTRPSLEDVYLQMIGAHA
jgi:ABC-2 type transport system ATP-binding protein